MESRVQRPLFNPEQVGGHILDVVGESVPVQLGTRRECPEHEERQCALEDVVLLFPFCHLYLPSYAYLAMVTVRDGDVNGGFVTVGRSSVELFSQI